MSAQRIAGAALTAGIIALTAGIFALDLFTPLGWADGFLYLLPLILIFRSPQQHRLVGFAVLCSGLILLGWILSPPGGSAGQIIYNRAIGIAALWMTAFFLRHRKQVEKALYLAQEENEERFTLLMDHANDAIAYLDLHGIIQWASLQTTVLTGRPMADLVGSPVMSVLTPTTAIAAEARLAAVRRGEAVPPLVEFEILRPNGELAVVEANITSVQGAAGVAGRLLVLRDITARKRVEKQLVQHAKRMEILSRISQQINSVLETPAVMRTLVTSAMDLTEGSAGMYGLMQEGRMVFHEYNDNEQWRPIDLVCEKGYGVPGWVMTTLKPYVCQDAERDPHVIPDLRKKWKFYNFVNVPILNANGELLGCLEILNKRDRNPFSEHDLLLLQGLAASAAIALENSQMLVRRARAEETIRENAKRIRAIFEQAPLGIAVINSHTGQFLEINEQYCTITGFSEEEMLSRTFQGITHPEDIQADLNNMKLLLEGKIASFEMDKRYIRKDDSVVWVHLTVVPLWWGAEHPRLHIAMAEDTTERKLVEKQLVEAHSMLHQIVSTIPLYVFWKDRESNYLGCNRLFAESAGVGTSAAIVGKNDYALAWRETAEMYRADDRHVMETNTPKLSFEEPMTRPDGSVLWLRTSKVPLQDRDGKVFGVLGICEDITARRQAEEALHIQASVLGSMLEGVSLSDENGVILYTNPAEDAMFGYEPGELIGKHVTVLNTYPPEENARIVEGVIEQLKANGSWEGEFSNRRKDGTAFTTFTHITALELSGKKYWVCVQEDITERKRAEESLKLFRVLLDQVRDSIEVIDPKTGRFMDGNERAWSNLGYARNELLSLTVPDIDPLVTRTVFTSNMRRLRETGKALLLDSIHLRKDGTTFPVEVSAQLVQHGKGKEYVVAIVRDITERKQAEEMLLETQMRLNLVVASSNIGFWDWDLRNNQTHFSAIWKRQLGYGEQEITDRYEEWESRLHPDDRDHALAKVDDCQRNPGKQYEVEFRMRHKDGTYRWIFTQGSVLVDDAGKSYRMLGSHIDITERKRVEEEHRDLYERLQASHDGLRRLSRRLMEVQEQERRHLAREMHDEIGQTLTAAKINVQQALHAPASSEAGTHLEESVRILDHALQQVRSLALDLRPSMLDDLGLVPTLKWLVDRHAQASEIAVTLSTERLDVRPTPEIELACYRVAQEALTNAVRHAQANQIGIELARSGQELALVIRDNGIGFDMTAMLSRAAKGDSIGLLGMQERVALTGGKMELLSSPGQGTEIRAWFPLAVPSPSQDTRA